MRRMLALAALATATALTMSACSEADTFEGDLDPSRLGDETVQNAMAELYEAAVEAGEDSVVAYGPGEAIYADAYRVFEARYPEISIEGEYIFGAELSARLDQEFGSGNRVGAVQTGGPAVTLATYNADRCMPFDPVAGEGIAYSTDDAVAPDGSFRAVVGYPFGIAYNTDLLSDDAPAGWGDLADAEWAGRFVMADPRQVSGTSQTVAQLLHAGAFDESWLEAVAANDPQIRGNAALTIQAVVTEQAEFDAFAQYAQYFPYIRDGEPIGFVFPTEGGARMEYHYSCILADAPNPNATELFFNWLFTPEGQEALSTTGVYGLLPGAPPPSGLPSLEDVTTELIIPSALADANRVTQEGIQIAQRIFGE